MHFKTILFASLPIFYLFLLLFQMDGSMSIDLGRQIIMGSIIYHCRCVPEINIFSLTNPQYPVINQSWLSELIYFLLVNKFGLTSLLFLKFFLVFLTFLLLYFISFKKSAVFASVFFSLCTLMIFSGRFNVRPELFSFLFISLFLFLFELYKRKNDLRFLLPIPVLLILWTNLHIYFFIGQLLFAFLFIEQLIIKKKVTHQFIILTLCVLFAPLINPAFFSGAIYPYAIWHNFGYAVSEDYPPLIFIGPYPFSIGICVILLFEIISCFALAGIFVIPKKESLSEKLNTALGIILGQLLYRGMAIFSLLSLPLLIKEYEFIHKYVQLDVKKKFGNIYKITLLIVFALLFVYQLLSINYSPGFGFAYQPAAEKGVDFFIKNKLQGAIFNNFSTGNYLIYRLYPQEQVFLDGRPEAYPISFFKMYFKMLQNNAYFNKIANAYHINVIFLGLDDDPQQTRAFLLKLSTDKTWAPVFWDGRNVIFVRNNKKDEKIINDNRKVKDIFVKSLQ